MPVLDVVLVSGGEARKDVMVVSEQGCRLAANGCVWMSHTAVATALDLNGPALEQ